jgi:selenide,water dikinase
MLPGAVDFAREGIVTGASGRNFAGYGSRVSLGSAIGEAEKALLTDPQTSGGLLAACAPEAVDEVLAIFAADGFTHAVVIGDIREGEPRVVVA